MELHEVKKILSYLDPDCTNQEWVEIGMGLKHEGFDVSVWEEWSRHGSKYKSGECERRWASFRENTGNPVTIASVVQKAKDYGYDPKAEKKDDVWLDPWHTTKLPAAEELQEEYKPKDPIKRLYPKWDPVKEVKTYLSALFAPSEYVSYVTESMKDQDGKLKPGSKGSMRRTCKQILEDIDRKYERDPERWFGSALGIYDEDAGVWVRFNPIDGKGAANSNVTRWDYALVESDNMSLDEQLELYKRLQLPIKLIVYSGSRSLHAIVKVQAKSAREYTERVLKLFDICQANGMDIDMQNKNPSRLSRLPGAQRGDNQQYLVSLDMGCSSWDEWLDEVYTADLNLPDPINGDDFFATEIILKPVLIDGILRQGHKMIISGPSKAGKSFALMELCGAITSGRKWLGSLPCAQGRVLYINLELDPESCKKRFQDVYKAQKYSHNGLLDVWNLRGSGKNLKALKRAIIRKATAKEYAAIIVDPIYKIITGSENDASEMAEFCGYMDEIAESASSAIIYCHHYSKGAQGHKVSMDRASGSGVFARDADAITSMTQLRMPIQKISKLWEERLIPKLEEWMALYDSAALSENISKHKWQPPQQGASKDDWDAYFKDRSYPSEYGLDLLKAFRSLALTHPSEDFQEALKEAERLFDMIENATAWRIEYTLREFANHRPTNIYFIDGIHYPDTEGWLVDAKFQEQQETGDKAGMQEGRARKAKTKKDKIISLIIDAVEELEENPGEGALQADIQKYLEGDVCGKTVRNYIKDNPDVFTKIPKSTNKNEVIVRLEQLENKPEIPASN